MVLAVYVATYLYGRLELEQDGLGHEDLARADTPAGTSGGESGEGRGESVPVVQHRILTAS